MMWAIDYNRVDNDKIKLEYLTKIGGHNEYPQPYKYISYKEYFMQVHTYQSKFRDLRQIFKPDKGMVKDLNIEFKHDIAYGIEKDYETGKIRFLKIGCDHDFTERSLGNCENEYTCKKCGIVKIIDSSG